MPSTIQISDTNKFGIQMCQIINASIQIHTVNFNRYCNQSVGPLILLGTLQQVGDDKKTMFSVLIDRRSKTNHF
jgi:hypothetical protein